MSDYNTKQWEEERASSFFDKLDERLISKEDKKDVYSFHSLTQILEKEFPQEQYLVDRLIPLDGITCIGGLPATMKSYFTNYLALQITKGEMVFNKYKTKPTNILFIDKENKLQRIQQRFLKLGIDSESAKHIYYLESNFLLENAKDLATVISFIKDHDIQLTFIDTLVRAHNKEENSASEMNRVFIALKELLLNGSAVCFLHHFNKRGSFGQIIDVRDQLRGSGDILAMVDSFIALTRKENFIELEQGKSRDETCINKFLFESIFEEHSTKFVYIRDVEQDERIEAVLLGDKILSFLANNSATRKFILSTFADVSTPTIDRALKQLKLEEKITAYSNGQREHIYSINNQKSLE